MSRQYIDKLIAEHQLAPDFVDTVNRWYRPVARMAYRRFAQKLHAPLLLGVQGTQGSGKSTLSSFVASILVHEFGLKVVVLSIDDFYLTRADRRRLAAQVHPLLQTRGVPGTHDLPLLNKTLTELSELAAGESMIIPRFDKAQDDRFPEARWDHQSGPIDIIIFEGWCIGAPAQVEDDLKEPQNALEASEDADGTWRRYVNEQLAGPYQKIFSQLDALVVIQSPSFDCVYEWRLLQEKKLAERLRQESPDKPNNVLSEDEVRRFISHYERITRLCLAQMPTQADCVLALAADHRVTSFKEKQKGLSTLPLLVSTDLDGTLLDHHTYEWQPALPAISALQAFSVPIVMNTRLNGCFSYCCYVLNWNSGYANSSTYPAQSFVFVL